MGLWSILPIIRSAASRSLLPLRIAFLISRHAMLGRIAPTANLLGPIGAEPKVWTECLFANPVADIAVLGPPDDQELGDEAEAYEALVESVTPFSISDAPEQGQVWLLSLERKWFSCETSSATWVNGPIWLTTHPKNIQGGMSGSPIVSDSGAAVGVITLGSNMKDIGPNSGPNPRLVRDLPGWLSYAQQKRAAIAASKRTEAILEEIKRKSQPSTSEATEPAKLAHGQVPPEPKDG